MRHLSILDLRDALDNPAGCFANPMLQKGVITRNTDKSPRLFNGAFACVAQIQTEEGMRAVRIYLRRGAGRAARYRTLQQHIQRRLHELQWEEGVDPESMDLFVPCIYQEEGIWVDGAWHEIAVMPWVEGVTLGTYVNEAIRQGDTAALNLVADRWARLHNQMNELQIGHGDLQHGNIMVETTPTGPCLRLIDYDGVWVPGVNRSDVNEIGQPAYSHPNRTREDWGPDIDLFSWYIIYLSLRALAVDPSLRARQGRADSADLLFTEEDLAAPERSTLFQELMAWGEGEGETNAPTAAPVPPVLQTPIVAKPEGTEKDAPKASIVRAFRRTVLSLVPAIAGLILGIRVLFPFVPLDEITETPTLQLPGALFLVLWILIAGSIFWHREYAPQRLQRASALTALTPELTPALTNEAAWQEVWSRLNPEQRATACQVGDKAHYLCIWCLQTQALPAPPRVSRVSKIRVAEIGGPTTEEAPLRSSQSTLAPQTLANVTA